MKRYTLGNIEIYGMHTRALVVSDDGEWVRYTDIEALQKNAGRWLMVEAIAEGEPHISVKTAVEVTNEG